MGGMSITHWIIVGVIAILLFGRGRFSSMAGDVAKGLKAFKSEMREDEPAPQRIAADAESTKVQ